MIGELTTLYSNGRIDNAWSTESTGQGNGCDLRQSFGMLWIISRADGLGSKPLCLGRVGSPSQGRTFLQTAPLPVKDGELKRMLANSGQYNSLRPVAKALQMGSSEHN
jgi:hypothetical protein